MRNLTLLLLLVLVLFHVPAEAQQDRTQYFLVKSWRLTGTWTYTKHFQTVKVDGDVTTTRTYAAEIWAQAQFRMIQSKNHSSKRYRWQLEKCFKPVTEASVRIVDFTLIKPKHFPESWTKTEISLEGKALDGDGRLDIEPEDGASKVVAGFMSMPGEIKITNSKGGNQRTESPFYFSSGVMECKGQASGMTFGGFNPEGTSSVPRERPDLNPVHFKWQVSPWEQEPEHEATLDLSDHAWLPDPAASVKVLVKWEGKAEKVRIYLENISAEPGACLNDEAKEDSKEADLTIDKQGDWAVMKEGEGAGTKYTAIRPLPRQDPPQEVELEIKTTDYGAWGSVHAEVLLDGKWKDAKFNGKTTMGVPYDVDENHIADQWENENGVKGKPASADDDEKPEGNGFKGDGLTNYEEYRGFMEDGKHVRTKPELKDLFICDDTASASASASGGTNNMAKEGIALFEAVTELKVHSKLTLAELSAGRIVNRNHKEGAHKVDQHGVKIIRGSAGTHAEAIQAPGTTTIGPPRTTEYVTLPAGSRYRQESGWSANSKTDHSVEDNISTVAHELGHSVGISHHGDNMYFALWSWVKQTDGTFHLSEQGYRDDQFTEPNGAVKLIRAFFEADGAEATYGGPPPGVLDDKVNAYKVLVGGRGGEHSGQENCILRYPDGNAYLTAPSSDVRWIPDPADWKKREVLCDNAAGTGINADTHEPQSRYGNASAGKCKGQLVVNDAN